MKRLAFTLLEVVVSITIVLALAALSYPVFTRAVSRAKQTSTASRLHQMHLALKLYQQDSGESALYGSPSAMGLPLASNLLATRLGQSATFWKSPCGDHPLRPVFAINYNYFPGQGGSHWDDYIEFYRENMVVVFDLNCNDISVDPENEYLTKRGIGVLLGGQVVTRNQKGDMHRASWWASVEP